jgi:acetyl-CoA carboxylase alpha subunit
MPDVEYHTARAEQELAQAEKAENKATAKLHNELAKFHQQAAARANDRPTLGIVVEK